MKNSSPPPDQKETNGQKLARHLASVMQEVDAYLNAETDEKRDELEEHIQPLCLMKRIEVEVQLAWGGPAYGFKLQRETDSRDFLSGVFYYANWFTYDETDLSPQEVDKVVQAYALDCLE